ncbi:peptidoglycan hydrolase-like protein with peptidoglycan-binding domain [Agromyces terreus]|uniref:Peptidoglycan hydrolase-like protein with peptidoglycan-binding domain n=1 Tax=Agromyces terreus TaxID=424795 RepID=A0A9X2KB65_9MICO|nr:peptidoglycan-binding protein [Agromyces terreus]MCP2370284.1 peptidoglycan hydrolase-like protein with peptidoglycan-binding domain [Agromyces terreus]
MKRIAAVLLATLMMAGIGLTAGAAPAMAAPNAWPVVQSGQTSANVKAVQYLVTARGYATTADGVFGSGTKAKVVAFQKSRKLTADGIVGAGTWPQLTSATVKSGSSGNDVRAAQTLLNKYGYKLGVDGSFGAATKSAAVAFQKSVGLTADGIVGPNTWRYLASGKASAVVVPTDCAKVTGPVAESATTVVKGPGGYSFRVHKCLSSNLSKLLTAANAAGYTLGGWSYRSNAQQIELRKQHCGTSHYAIYEMPSSQCSPPTAIPGRSMHERGLAIDFNSKGASLTTAAFNWLKANAGKYGLKNLPSEKWHWSTNGN